jgi:chaperonin cofactor prefoldin
MSEPENFIQRLLREMRPDMTGHFETLRADVGALRDDVRENSKRLENIRQAAFGESVLGRYAAAAEVEERLEAIEKRLTSLEARS